MIQFGLEAELKGKGQALRLTNEICRSKLRWWEDQVPSVLRTQMILLWLDKSRELKQAKNFICGKPPETI